MSLADNSVIFQEKNNDFISFDFCLQKILFCFLLKKMILTRPIAIYPQEALSDITSAIYCRGYRVLWYFKGVSPAAGKKSGQFNQERNCSES